LEQPVVTTIEQRIRAEAKKARKARREFIRRLLTRPQPSGRIAETAAFDHRQPERRAKE
jgi:hypothetical protein